MEGQHTQVAEAHPEGPHGHDAHGHGKAGVACRTQDVGHGKAGRPDEQRNDVEPHHHFQRHGVGLGREAEQAQCKFVGKQEGRKVHEPCAAVGKQHQAAGVIHGLILFACAKALAHHGQCGHAHGVGRDVQKGGGGVCHGVGRNGGGAKGGGQAGNGQLADLEHAVLDAGRDAHPQDLPDEPCFGGQCTQAVHTQRAVGLLQQVQHSKAGNGAGHKACQRCAHDAHFEAVDQHGVAADVHHVHHQTGQHADLAVALRPEQGCTGVVQADEGVAQGREQEVGLGIVHHVRVDGAKDALQDGMAAHHHNGGHQQAEAGQDEQDLRRCILGILWLLPADVLAGDHRAAGGQCAHDLDHQGVEAVHKAHAGHSGFTHRGDHQRVGQTDGHAERLLCDQRQQQGNELLPGEQRRLMERGRFGCCHRFLRNGNKMHLDT